MRVDELLKHKCFENLNYRIAEKKDMPIKVIGVGNGGGNAVTNLYYENIEGTTLVICDTNDRKLQASPVEKQILLKTPHESGIDFEKYSQKERDVIQNYYYLSRGMPGYGAGNEPIIAQLAAENTLPEINNLLENTQMVFLTASMGGGSGTGATAVIAEACHKKNILTVGIVTLPFGWEGKKKMREAWAGVEKMKPFVDALLIILNDNLTNEKILEKYKDKLSFSNYNELYADELFKLADNVLADAVKSVVEMIEKTGYIDLDFADVYTALKGGGGTIMDSGYATGENRFYKAMENALGSPLLYNFDISNATRVVMAFYSSREHRFSQPEFNQIQAFSQRFADEYWFKLGMYYDDTLGEQAKVTILATSAEGKDILPSELETLLNFTKDKDATNKSPLKIFDDKDILADYQNKIAYNRVL